MVCALKERKRKLVTRPSTERYSVLPVFCTFSCRAVCYSITNLKFWGRSEQIINKTLQLLSDLSVGYSSVRKLVKLEAVQFLLNSHTVSVPGSLCLLPDHPAIGAPALSNHIPQAHLSNPKKGLPCHTVMGEVFLFCFFNRNTCF